MALKVFPLNLGDIELDKSFVVWQTGCGEKIWSPTTAWLITGADKPMLVDSSFRGVEDAKREQGLTCRRSDEQSLEAQLGKHNLRLSDIGCLIHTHLHMDHAGQDYLLPNARIVAQRREIQNAAAPNMFPVQFYDRLNIARIVSDFWTRVDVLDGDAELFPGVRALVTPGHTPGHQMIYVDTASGTTIITGDAAMNVEYNVRRGIPPGFIDSMADVMNGLRRIARDGKHILPTHDDKVFELYPNGVE